MTSGSPIVNGERVFLDINGDPLSGGSVYFYTPGTTDPATTWVDQGLTVANANPIVLDQAGRAIIWGDGLYRQVVQDQFGNVQWDQETSAGFVTSLGTLDITNANITNANITNASITNANISNLNVGSLSVSGNSTFGGTLSAASGTLDIINGLVVSAAPGQLDAALFKGDVEIDGSDGGKTFSTGQRFSVQGSNDPGFIVNNSGDGSVFGMWDSGGLLTWGTADGAPSGNISTKLMTLDASGNLIVTGDLAVTFTISTKFLIYGGQDVRLTGPSDGVNPLVLPHGAYVFYIPGLPS